MSLDGVANTEYASLSGKIHTLVIDKTLTISGACADAKATGEAVAKLEDAFADIELMSPEGINKAIDTKMAAINSSVNALAEMVEDAAVTETYTVEVDGDSWYDSSDGFWMNNVSVPGLLSTDNPIADVVLGLDKSANKLYEKAWGLVEFIQTYDDRATIYATDRPDISFTMQLKVVR